MSTYRSPFINILAAAGDGTVEDVKYFIEQNADYVHAYSNNGWTPLHCAALHNPNVVVLKYLVTNGASVHKEDKNGMAPLHLAVSSNSNVEILRFLISKGADVNAKGYFNGMLCTPLDLADAEQERVMREAMQQKQKNDEMLGQYVANRAMQLRLLIQGNFFRQGIELCIEVIDGHFGDNDWLFVPGFVFRCGNDVFYLSTRGHIARLQSYDPNDSMRWIESDVGLQARMSNKDDIIAYPTGTSQSIIDQVLAICNSAALLH